MGNHTVDNTVDNEKEFIEGPAGKKENIRTTAVAWQNNKPQKLEIEVTNNEGPTNLPFMIENGEFVEENDEYKAAKLKANTREDIEALEAKRKKAEKEKADEEEGRD